MSALEIARTIKAQLHDTGLRRVKVMSWGAHNFSGVTRNTYLPHSLGGLTFKVRGRKHQGYVAVLLMPSDTYTVLLMHTDGTIADTIPDVYWDRLTETLDAQIES